MAFPSSILLFCSFLLISSSLAKTSFQPKALVIPVSKDSSTLQHLIHLNQRTPLVPVSLTLDLGGQLLWVDCFGKSYISSSHRPIRCNSAQCKLAKSDSCFNNTCGLFPENTISKVVSSGDLGSDVVSIQSTDGKNPGKIVSVSNFILACGYTVQLDGLANGVEGMAGLGRDKLSLPSQFSSSFNFPRKFSICLSSFPASKGVLFLGDGPFKFLLNTEILSKSLTYTPLILNPVTTASFLNHPHPSTEYFIGVKSIKINEKIVLVNNTLLSINKEGKGGTKISTVHPYTILETSIYKAIVKAFTKSLSKVPRVPPVSPFGVCYDQKRLGSTRVGPAVPQIDLVLQSESVYWTIFGANSMVQVNDNAVCLGFIDGGVNPWTSIVIGAHQIEDNLLHFDLEKSKLGFSSSLLFMQTTCGNFNFTSNA